LASLLLGPGWVEALRTVPVLDRNAMFEDNPAKRPLACSRWAWQAGRRAG
jgi:hypothetical protein